MEGANVRQKQLTSGQLRSVAGDRTCSLDLDRPPDWRAPTEQVGVVAGCRAGHLPAASPARAAPDVLVRRRYQKLDLESGAARLEKQPARSACVKTPWG